VAEDARFEAQAKGVTVAVEMPDNIKDGAGPVISGSAELLRKGLDNVLRNAVRVSQPGQSISVQVAYRASSHSPLSIAVDDSGPGVPADSLERIFEPFVRGADQSSGSGYGLGLAIARSAAQAHHGTVTAVNRTGGGLRVVFELPVQYLDWRK
jgi:two-component system OmpR family sensor kinase